MFIELLDQVEPHTKSAKVPKELEFVMVLQFVLNNRPAD